MNDQPSDCIGVIDLPYATATRGWLPGSLETLQERAGRFMIRIVPQRVLQRFNRGGPVVLSYMDERETMMHARWFRPVLERAPQVNDGCIVTLFSIVDQPAL